MNEDIDEDSLDEDARDKLVAAGRAMASALPMVGGIIGEIVTQVVPAQRLDRIVSYLRNLNARLSALELDAEAIMRSPESIDLIEEGGFQAARATTNERVEQIATIVANGLNAEEADEVRRKRLARIFGQLDNDEILLLNAYGQSYGGGHGGWDNINRPEPAHLQSSEAQIDAEKLFDAGREHLLRLGLLRKNYQRPTRGQSPEFDTQKGDFKHTVEVSYLGRMLLRHLDMPSPFDRDD